MRARCVFTEHLGDRRKSPVWSTEATNILGSTAGVPEERSTALMCAGWSASLNRHKTWSDCKNGLKKEGWLGRSGYTQCQRWGAAPLPNPVLGAAACQAYVSRKHARPQPPRPRAGTEEGRRSLSVVTEPSGTGAKLDPPDHTQPSRRLWPL
jgi:hypothetical protein